MRADDACTQEHELLQGRALIFASRMAEQLPVQMQDAFFQGTFQIFSSGADPNNTASLVLKVCAMRALKR